jgi:two-component system sensor histidine kinase PilS (NtrC family)
MDTSLNANLQSRGHSDPELAWRVLGLLNIFRLLVPIVLVSLFWLGGAPHVVGESAPQLFLWTAAGYFIAAVAAIWLLKRRWPDFRLLAYLPLSVDILAIALLNYASGGVESGLGILLLIPIGAISLLSSPRVALVLAAIATLALLAQQVVLTSMHLAGSFGLTQAGYYGGMLFVLAGASSYLANRLRETEELVRQRELDLANLAQLSEYIVQHLRESIVVVDSEDRIRLINESAREILGGDPQAGGLLGEVSPKLLYLVESWRQHPEGANGRGPSTMVAADGSREVQAHFAPLGRQRPAPVLVFLEDLSLLTTRVQQTKLAALGRLSASIAHEIRNPVGAMSHAAQLLGETASLTAADKRLTEIIQTNADRVSTIITNVLQLSRRENTRPERLMLGDWIEEFLSEFRDTLQLTAAQITYVAAADDVEVRVDPSHLHQIAWNLCDNAVRCSGETAAAKLVELHVGRLGASGRPFLEVADRGPGIDPKSAERIFEPFFTERKGGTGLGLFIARELAQCNGATLLFEPRATGGSIFRIIFADPQRWEG